MTQLTSIYRYPVKGLSAEKLHRVTLAVGETLPFDRAYAIENGPSGFDPAAPKHFPKIVFLMLMRHERLAELATAFDDATATLTIRKDGAVVAEGNLETDEGRSAIAAFFDTFAAKELKGPAKVLHGAGHSFSDSRHKVVSLINLETVRALGKDLGADLHPLRFRGNLYVEGMPAWAEFDWLGKTLQVSASARLHGDQAHRPLRRHQRQPADCGARPDAAKDDANRLRARRLRRCPRGHWRRNDCRRRRGQRRLNLSRRRPDRHLPRPAREPERRPVRRDRH